MIPPSQSGNVIRRFAVLTLAASAVALSGCGGSQAAADRAAQEKIADAHAAWMQHQLAAAQTASDAAGAIEGLSPEMTFTTRMLQGRVRIANSQQLLKQAQDIELNVTRLLGQTRVATGQVQLAQAQIKADEGYDPAAAIDQLKAKIADAQGSPDALQWRPPTLPAYTPPAIVEPVAPAAPAPESSAAPTAAPSASAANPTGQSSGMTRFFSGFLGGSKPAATAPPKTAPPAVAPEPASPAAAPAPTAPLAVNPAPAKPLDLLFLKSLAGLDAQIAQLQSEIAANRDQALSIGKDRTALLSQSDDAQQKSLGDTGQTSVDDVKTAAELRRKAADLTIQSDAHDAALVHLKADFDKAQIQHAGVQAAIDAFNKQIADLEVTWKVVQQDIDTQKQAIAALAGPAAPGSTPAAAPAADSGLPVPPAPALTIADQCAQLKGMVASVRDFRDRAADELKEAINDFNKAATAGDAVRTALSAQLTDRTPPGEKTALQQLQETFSAGEARMAAAGAERDLALDYADEAMIARQLKWSLTLAQSALGTDAPSAIADCTTAVASPSMEEYAEKAEERFKDALDHFDSLTTQSLPGPAATARKTDAMVAKMITAFGAKQLSLAMQDKAVAGQTPKELQQMIDDLAKNVSDVDPGLLPAIPYSIAAATPTPAN